MTSAGGVMTYVAVMTSLVLLKPRVSTAHLPSRDLDVDVAVTPAAPQMMFVRTELTIAVVVTPVDSSTCDDDQALMTMTVSSHRPTTVVALITR